jgi:hypothetical protein
MLEPFLANLCAAAGFEKQGVLGRQQVIDLIDHLQTDRPQTRM